MFCKRRGTEGVAEQLSASQVGIFVQIFFVIPCNDFVRYNIGILQSSYTNIRFDESVYHSLS